MIGKKELEKIKKITEEFFEKMDFDVEIEVKKINDSIIPIYIKTEEPKTLIGEKGQTMIDVQRLLKSIIKKNIFSANSDQEPFYINIDINGYKEKRIEYLKELTKSVADEVALFGKERVLAPMSGYERRIIHLEIEERAGITSESIGEEAERRVIIKLSP